MRGWGRVPLILLILACLAALTASAFPGVLEDMLHAAILLGIIFVMLIGLPVGLVAALVLLVLWAHGTFTVPRMGPLFWNQIAWSVAVLTLTGLLIICNVPQRMMFAMVRPRFEELLAAPKNEAGHGAPLNERVGPFWVDRCGVDPRGGVYFRTHTGPDGLGPDEMSYGFCFQPNPKGTPFGAAHYGLRAVSPEWFSFAASNDWY